MAQVDGMLRRVLTLPRSASADGYDEHVQCDDIASLSSETKRRKAAGVHRIVITGRPWQIGATFGATPGGHTRSSWGAERPYFTGLSRSHFKMAEREGFPLRLLNSRLKSEICGSSALTPERHRGDTALYAAPYDEAGSAAL